MKKINDDKIKIIVEPYFLSRNSSPFNYLFNCEDNYAKLFGSVFNNRFNLNRFKFGIEDDINEKIR